MKKRILLMIISVIICVMVFITIKLFNNNDVDDHNKSEFSYTPLMYKICDSDSCIYLLGSIHIGDEKVNKFNNVIIDAYNDSDLLAVELDITDVKIDIKEFMLENGTIDNYISEELNSKLNNFANNHSLFPLSTLKYMKLEYMYDYLSILPYLENGYNSDGVDSYFIGLAKEDNKKIISLETYEEQLNVLMGYSGDFYVKQIEYIIDNYDEVTDNDIKLYDAYVEGNEKELVKLMEEDQIGFDTEEEKKFVKSIYDDRNEKMAKKVEEFLDNNEKVFMTVGTAHVIGNNGIIDLLKDKYKISKVE